VRVHHDLVGGERDEGAPRHRVVRDEHGHPARVIAEGARDLLRGQHQPAGRVEDDVDGELGRRQPDSPQHLLGVLDVDVADDGKPEEAHRLFAVDQRDHATAPAPLQLLEEPEPRRLLHRAGDEGLEERDDEEHSQQIR
jgi:hypothetical protein